MPGNSVSVTISEIRGAAQRSREDRVAVEPCGGLAREFNMTLVGFLRGDTFNIYAGEERIA